MLVTRSFSNSELETLVGRAVAQQGQQPEYVKVIAGDGDEAKAYFGAVLRGGKRVQIWLGSEQTRQAVIAGAATTGVHLDPTTLKFTNTAGRGYGGGPTTTATAKEKPAGQVNEVPQRIPGQIGFLGTISQSFDRDALKAMLTDAASRAGHQPDGYVHVTCDEKGVGKAEIRIKSGGGGTAMINLSHDELVETLAAELTAKGYVVAPDGVTMTYTPGSGHGGGGPRVSATVRCTAVPI